MTKGNFPYGLVLSLSEPRWGTHVTGDPVPARPQAALPPLSIPLSTRAGGHTRAGGLHLRSLGSPEPLHGWRQSPSDLVTRTPLACPPSSPQAPGRLDGPHILPLGDQRGETLGPPLAPHQPSRLEAKPSSTRSSCGCHSACSRRSAVSCSWARGPRSAGEGLLSPPHSASALSLLLSSLPASHQGPRAGTFPWEHPGGPGGARLRNLLEGFTVARDRRRPPPSAPRVNPR